MAQLDAEIAAVAQGEAAAKVEATRLQFELKETLGSLLRLQSMLDAVNAEVERMTKVGARTRFATAR